MSRNVDPKTFLIGAGAVLVVVGLLTLVIVLIFGL